MSFTSPAIQTLAKRLLESEAQHASTGDADSGALVRVCAKLSSPLVKLAGIAGFSSLLSRALSLAARRDPALQSLRVGAEGSLEGLEAIAALGHRNLERAGVILVAELLGLLVALIGESLMLSIIRTSWPNQNLGITTLGSKEQP